jgi:hypothetical protein
MRWINGNASHYNSSYGNEDNDVLCLFSSIFIIGGCGKVNILIRTCFNT